MSDLVRSTRAVLAALAGAATLVGCAAGPGGGGDVAQWSVLEEVRIGSATDPAQAFSQVSTLAVDDEGRVYVPMLQQGNVRVYDEDGTQVDVVGRRGREPGEFDRIYALGFVGDSLYAIDFGTRRITYFSTDGELLRTHDLTPPPVDEPFLPGMPFAVFPDGSMAIGTAWPASVEQEALARVPQLRIDASWESTDTVAWLGFQRTGRRVMSGGRPLPVGSPFSDDAFAIFSADGSRIVSIDRTLPSGTGAGTATFGVTVSDGWGDTIYSRRYAYDPVEIGEAAVDRAVQAAASRVSGAFGSAGEAEEFVRSAMFIPTHYPPVSTALFDEDGTLWLQREAIPELPQQWMVLNVSGEHIADAELPAGLRVMVLRDGAVWGVVNDERGVPFVVRYRVVQEG